MQRRGLRSDEQLVESARAKTPTAGQRSAAAHTSRIQELQRHAGNRAVAQLFRKPAEEDHESRTGMPAGFREQMESLLGHDLSAVRVHRDSMRAPALQATALNEGTEIHLAPGQPSPETAAGRQLLGHELTHVVQQAHGRVHAEQTVGSHTVNTDLGLENEADAVGLRAVRGERGTDAAIRQAPIPAGSATTAVTQLNGDSVPLDKFTSAVMVHSEYAWTLGTDERTIKVWDIARSGVWDFHLSAILDKTGRNVTKFHFTLRQGPGKGTDAFAWYTITGHNAQAQVGARSDAGQVALFNDPALPGAIQAEVGGIDAAAASIFSLTKQFIK